MHYDNTWNTHIATENIRKVTTALGVDLFTHVVDNREIDDLKNQEYLAISSKLDEIQAEAFAVIKETAKRFNDEKFIINK